MGTEHSLRDRGVRGQNVWRMALVLSVLPLLGGCARMQHQSMTLWDRVRWTTSDEPEATVVPEVSANVARTAIETIEPRESLEENSGEESVAEAVAQPVSNQQPVATSDPFATPAESGTSNRLSELRAALSADADRAWATATSMAGLHSLQVRVDGLLQRTKELARGGELQEAKRTAQLAAELSDSVALEFLPTEDRPDDLLREIDARLQAQGVSIVDPPDSPAEPETIEVVGSASANGPQTLVVEPEEPPVETVPASVEVLPAITFTPEPSEPVAARRVLSKGTPWKDTAPENASSETSEDDPRPTSVAAISPLPGFRDREAKPNAAEPSPSIAPSRWLYWSDWLALCVLMVLLSGLALAMKFRDWRNG